MNVYGEDDADEDGLYHECVTIRVIHSRYQELSSEWIVTDQGQLYGEKGKFNKEHGMVQWTIHKLVHSTLSFGAAETTHKVCASAAIHPGIKTMINNDNKSDIQDSKDEPPSKKRKVQ